MTNKNLILHFENVSAMCLYEWEMSGQISDGKYENNRPFNHWEWVCDILNMVVDGKAGVEGNSYHRATNWDNTFSKKYNLNEWFSKYIKNWRKNGDDDTIWATRIIAYGKFGKIYPTLTYEELRKFNCINILLEDLQVKIEKGETNPEVLFEKCTDFTICTWREKYYEAAKDYFTLDFIKKFVDLKYDIKECKADVASMQKSINTRYGVKPSWSI